MGEEVQFENLATVSEQVSKRDLKQRHGLPCCQGRRLPVIVAIVLVVLVVLVVVLLVTVGREAKKQKPDQSKSSPRRPNVVFILADDLGYNDVSYHGTQIRTPNMDELCADGVRLENYYVQPSCTPTRSQLLTGRYQIHLGLSHGNVKPCQAKGVPLDETLLPEKMKEAGYTTHMVGKWHIGHYKDEFLPNQRGFQTYYGMLLGADDHLTHSRWTSVQTSEGQTLRRNSVDLWDNDLPVLTETGHYSTHLFTEKAIDVINDQTQDQPFFLYLAYQAVHGPLQVPQRYLEMYENITDPYRRTLAAMATALDEGVGNVTEALKANGLWDNTVLIFSTDNGSHQPSHYNNGRNWPLRGGKASLFEGGIRAVAFVSGGYLQERGVVNHQLMHVSDWFPTLVKGVARGSVSGTKPLDGFDQWLTIRGKQASPRRQILHNIDILAPRIGTAAYNDTFDTRIRAGLRIGEMKLMTGNVGGYRDWIPPPDGKVYDVPVNTDPPEKNLWLFNLTSDPYETTDLSPLKPDLVRSMLDVLTQIQQTAVTPQDPEDDPRCSAMAMETGVWGPWL